MRKPATDPKTGKLKWPKLERGMGSWEWDEARQECVLRFMVNGNRTKVRSGVSTTEAIAKRDARMRQVEADNAAMVRLRNGRATVNQVVAKWLEFHIGAQKPTTRDLYVYCQRIIAAHPLGQMVASEVTKGDVQNMFVSLTPVPYGVSTLKKVRSVLGRAFEFGKDYGFNTENPALGAGFGGKARKPRDETPHLNAEQYPRMAAYLLDNPSPSNTALLVTLLCGLRPGEVLGMQWDVIDWQAGTLTVKRGMQRSQNGRVQTIVDEVKTSGTRQNNSKRTIKMPPQAVEALRRLYVERDISRKVVFNRPDGKPLRFDGLRWHCEKACVAVGVHQVSPHGLRHSCGSMMLHLGNTPDYCARYLGHSLAVFLETYRHDMTDVVIDPSDALGDFLAKHG
jgi:integrase